MIWENKMLVCAVEACRGDHNASSLLTSRDNSLNKLQEKTLPPHHFIHTHLIINHCCTLNSKSDYTQKRGWEKSGLPAGIRSCSLWAGWCFWKHVVIFSCAELMAMPPPAFMRLLHQEAPDSRTPTQQSGHCRSRAQARCSTPCCVKLFEEGESIFLLQGGGERSRPATGRGSHVSGRQENESWVTCFQRPMSRLWIISISSLLYLCSGLRLSERSALFDLIQTHINKKKQRVRGFIKISWSLQWSNASLMMLQFRSSLNSDGVVSVQTHSDLKRKCIFMYFWCLYQKMFRFFCCFYILVYINRNVNHFLWKFTILSR